MKILSEVIDINKFLTSVGAVVIGAIVVFLSALLTGIAVMLLWNWLMPTLFGLSEITYWQGCGLSLLAGLLFRNSNTSTKKD